MTYILSFLLVDLDHIDKEQQRDNTRELFSRALLFEEPPSDGVERENMLSTCTAQGGGSARLVSSPGSDHHYLFITDRLDK